MSKINETVRALSQLFPVKEYTPDKASCIAEFRIHSSTDVLKSLFIPSKVTDDDLPELYRKKANIIYMYMNYGTAYFVPYMKEMPKNYQFVGSLLCPPDSCIMEGSMLVLYGMSDSITSDEATLQLTTDTMTETEYIETYCLPLNPHTPTIKKITI